jgi:hypothetical protein
MRIPEIALRLRQGDTEAATQIAVRRLRGLGANPMVDNMGDISLSGDRLLACMLFPASGSDVVHLAKLVLRKPAEEGARNT